MFTKIRVGLNVVSAIIIACLLTYVALSFFYAISLSCIVLLVSLGTLEVFALLSAAMTERPSLSALLDDRDSDTLDRMIGNSEHLRSQYSQNGQRSFSNPQRFRDNFFSPQNCLGNNPKKTVNLLRSKYTPDNTLLNENGEILDNHGRPIMTVYNLDKEYPFRKNKRLDDMVTDDSLPLSGSKKGSQSSDITTIPEEKRAEDGDLEKIYTNAEDGDGETLVSEV